MKKGAILLFTCYFFLTTIGIVFGTHYCGKKISNSVWGVSLSNLNKCKCTHKSEYSHKKKCCSHTTKWIKAKTDNSKVETAFQLNKIEFSAAIIYLIYSFDCNIKSTFITPKVADPPLITNTPLFLKNRILLI